MTGTVFGLFLGFAVIWPAAGTLAEAITMAPIDAEGVGTPCDRP